MQLTSDRLSVILDDGKIKFLPWEAIELNEIDEGGLILMQPKNNLASGNIILLNKSGDIKWYAEPQSQGDPYVSIQLKEGKIIANTWACYRIELCIKTGKIVSKAFTK